MSDFQQPNQQQPFNSSFNSPMPKGLPNATATLVLGICSIATCLCYFLIGIPGITCGIIAMVLSRKDMRLFAAAPGEYSLSSYNNLKAGRICAIIGLSISALWFLFCILMIILLFTGTINDYEFHRYYRTSF